MRLCPVAASKLGDEGHDCHGVGQRGCGNGEMSQGLGNKGCCVRGMIIRKTSGILQLLETSRLGRARDMASPPGLEGRMGAMARDRLD
jgi:hypothetical protein